VSLVTTPRLSRVVTLSLVVAALLLGLTAFTTSGAQAHGATTPATAWVRVLHASPDAPAVNVLVNNKAAVSHLAFGHITKYLKLQANTSYDVKIVPAANPAAVVFEIKNATFKPGAYTAAAIGLLNPGKTGHAFSVKVFSDNNVKVPGKARVRVVHLSPNAPAVDVYARRNAGGYARVVNDLSYPNASGYLAVKPGFYTFAITPGSASSVSGAIYKTPTLHLFPRATYTAWAIGELGGGFRVLLTTDSGQR
jgi:hypothetical protein